MWEVDAFDVSLEGDIIVVLGGREEVAEKGLGLPFRRILELDPNIHDQGVRGQGPGARDG